MVAFEKRGRPFRRAWILAAACVVVAASAVTCSLDWADPVLDGGADIPRDADGETGVEVGDADGDRDAEAEVATEAEGGADADVGAETDGEDDADADGSEGEGGETGVVCGDRICDPSETGCRCPEDCPGTDDICNGVDDDCDTATDEDFDLMNDAANCGSCGRVCNLPHVSPQVCRDGDCAIGDCETGWSTCTTAPGCETPWGEDNCGSCGTACVGDRWICCGDMCVDAFNPDDCGGCGNVCAPAASAAGACCIDGGRAARNLLHHGTVLRNQLGNLRRRSGLYVAVATCR